MATVTFWKLWGSHPYPNRSCDTKLFKDQCAVRMGEALRRAGVNLKSFNGLWCYPGLKHEPRHILRAEELANWMVRQSVLFGTHSVYKKVTYKDFVKKKGVVFIKDGWGAGDHIDVWNGSHLKGGDRSWFARGKEVWFWELP
ncbi:type VI secretion system amidase effector protein Tae4 [Candidatus Thiosymbion oneisti]|uniref:type VI secretion system amidase effector protein Tae4 n=1 Tax=Candidatus Thiosymbion oneisti TaxID=589554 RepID=UPI00105C7929|nr:type VI secretion system amidase effector protein Tae4 [Candidatus Thiosymbion oneisti]